MRLDPQHSASPPPLPTNYTNLPCELKAYCKKNIYIYIHTHTQAYTVIYIYVYVRIRDIKGSIEAYKIAGKGPRAR